MGVRFQPDQKQAVLQTQQAASPARISLEQRAQRPETAQRQQTQATEQVPQTIHVPDQQTAPERVARDAGAQTPGSIIDLLA